MGRELAVEMTGKVNSGPLALNVGDTVADFIGIDRFRKAFDIPLESSIVIVAAQVAQRQAALGHVGKLLIHGLIFFLIGTPVAQRSTLGKHGGHGIVGHGVDQVGLEAFLQLVAHQVLALIVQKVVERGHILGAKFVALDDVIIVLDRVLQQCLTVAQRQVHQRINGVFKLSSVPVGILVLDHHIVGHEFGVASVGWGEVVGVVIHHTSLQMIEQCADVGTRLLAGHTVDVIDYLTHVLDGDATLGQ